MKLINQKPIDINATKSLKYFTDFKVMVKNVKINFCLICTHKIIHAKCIEY